MAILEHGQAETHRLAPLEAFGYRAATRVDTLGGNADEGREFAAFDIFGARRGGIRKCSSKTRKEMP